MRLLPALFLLLVMTFHARAQTYTTTFASDMDGWVAGFADYPAGQESFYELDAAHTTLPAPLNTSKYSARISGNNHSDDLFMFLKKQISGLVPNTTYNVRFDVEFASNVPTEIAGVGGAPGLGVTVKCGATQAEPGRSLDHHSYYRMTIDQGIQANPGADMDTIGHVGVTDTTTVYTLITRTNATHLFTITTDANGNVWAIIGTDSGFEATTTLYYNNIVITFSDPVPVELSSFSAALERDRIILNWITESESNNLGFDIERARGTSAWRTIGFLPGSGTTNSRQTYRFVDAEYAEAGVGATALRYRLKQIDFDGSYIYSPTVEVATDASRLIPDLLAPYPSPTNGTSVATVVLPAAATVSLAVYDVSGRLLIPRLSAAPLNTGTHLFTLPTDGLPTGLYYLRLSADGVSTIRTLTVIR